MRSGKRVQSDLVQSEKVSVLTTATTLPKKKKKKKKVETT